MKKPFRRAFIEITNACNLSCGFCAVSSRPAAYMSVENFAAAAARVKPLAAVVSLHVLGEPFMHPRLPEILGGPAAARLRDSIAAKTPMPAYCATCGFSAPGADLGAWKKI